MDKRGGEEDRDRRGSEEKGEVGRRGGREDESWRRGEEEGRGGEGEERREGEKKRS